MGTSTISMATFNSKLLNYQRVIREPMEDSFENGVFFSGQKKTGSPIYHGKSHGFNIV